MSEASSNDPLAVNSESGPMALSEALQMIQRLASLLRNGEFSDLVEAPLDGLLTTEQAAVWMQRTPVLLAKDAKTGKIPAIPCGKNQWRFHPRTILEEGHRRYFNHHPKK